MVNSKFLIKAMALAAMLTAVGAATSCGSGSGETAQADQAGTDTRLDATMHRSAADTASIRNLTIDYLGKLRDKEFDAALDMLTSWNDTTSTLSSLSLAERERVGRVMRLFPVVDYSIDEINIYSENDTEVLYTIEMFERPEGSDVPNTMKYVLNPRRINGKWYLCIGERFDNPDKVRREEILRSAATEAGADTVGAWQPQAEPAN